MLIGRWHAAADYAAHLTMRVNDKTAAHSRFKLCIDFETREVQHAHVAVQWMDSPHNTLRRCRLIVQLDVLYLALTTNVRPLKVYAVQPKSDHLVTHLWRDKSARHQLPDISFSVFSRIGTVRMQLEHRQVRVS